MDATIYHNPRCSTSRKVLEAMRAAGVEPRVVEYLKQPPSRTRLKQLLKQAGVGVREAIRSKEPVYAELGLADPALSDDQLLGAMVANPVLIERPIVETGKGVRLCRPPERVEEVL
jgi:arsenate reductase (glutaredoxin)